MEDQQSQDQSTAFETREDDNIFTEAEHEKQDAAIAAYIKSKSLPHPKEDKEFRDIMLAVVLTGHEKLEWNDIRAHKLMQEVPNLHDLISEAYMTGKYRKVRNLRQLRQSVLSAPDNEASGDGKERGSPTRIGSTEYQIAQVLSAAFMEDYQGSAVVDFIEMFRELESSYDKRKHYGRVVAILQSSGTGKSRLVKELGLQYTVFSICFRKSSMMNSGWPPGDIPASRFFNNDDDLDVRGEEMAAAFLGALFAKMASSTTTTSSFLDLKYGIPESPEALQRQAFFDNVASRAKELLQNEHQFLNKEREWVFADPSQSMSAKDRRALLETRAPDWHTILFNHFCQASLQDLRNKLAATGRHRLFIALDECTTLGPAHKNEKGPQKEMSLIAMQRILKAADIHDFIWFLLLDTNSSVIMLPPSGPDAPSFRLHEDFRPLSPFLYLGFNQMKDKMLRAYPSDALSLKNLKHLGRPYWYALSGGEVLPSARHKLFGPASDHESNFKPRILKHVLSAFAARIPFDLAQDTAGRHLAADSVSHGMRMLTGVVDGILITDTPSEPILAIAAADSLTKDRTTYASALKMLIRELVLKGTILDKGGLGELFSRLLLLLARDEATITIHSSFVTPTFPPTIHAIELDKFLSTLLGAPEVPHFAELLKSCRGKWVNFTHFVTYNRHINELTLEELTHAWFSGYAIQCCHTQPVFDGLVVVYDGSLDDPYDPLKLTYFVWQTKAKSAGVTTRVGEGLTGPPIIHTKNSDGKRRFKPQTFVFLMDLLHQAEFNATKSSIQLTFRQAAPLTKWKGYADLALKEEEPMNYCITARGTSYPVLSCYGVADELTKTFTGPIQRSQVFSVQQLEIKMLDSMYPFNASAVKEHPYGIAQNI